MRADLEILQGRRAVYFGSGQQFVDYFLHYANDHRDDWPDLEAEHANLLIATRRCWDAGDHVSLLAYREALQPYLDLQGHWADSLILNEWAIASAQASGDQVSAARFTHDRADILHQRGEYL